MINQRRWQKAFTLIEMLVVLVIVAIITTIAVVSFAGRADGRQMKLTGQVIENLVQVISQQSVLYPAILGVRFVGSGFHIYRYTTGGRQHIGLWAPLDDDHLSRRNVFHSGIVVSLLQHHHQGQDESYAPKLVFYPNGFNSKVTLKITNDSGNPIYHLVIFANGSTRLQEML